VGESGTNGYLQPVRRTLFQPELFQSALFGTEILTRTHCPLHQCRSVEWSEDGFDLARDRRNLSCRGKKGDQARPLQFHLGLDESEFGKKFGPLPLGTHPVELRALALALSSAEHPDHVLDFLQSARVYLFPFLRRQ